MQDTSELYKDLLGQMRLPGTKVRAEYALAIGETGVLITERGAKVTFGGHHILVASSGADAGYRENLLISMKTTQKLFSQNGPAVGCCVAGEIDVEMLSPIGDIPRKARLVPYVRLTDGYQASEWIQKGVYYIDTRQEDQTYDGLKSLKIHGYDSMLMAEADYPPSSLNWPAKDIDIVREIADAMGVPVDKHTVDVMTLGHTYQWNTEYSQREILGYIASGYAGCFIMTDVGELRLVRLGDLPKETRYLVTSGADRRSITFGGDRILV